MTAAACRGALVGPAGDLRDGSGVSRRPGWPPLVIYVMTAACRGALVGPAGDLRDGK